MTTDRDRARETAQELMTTYLGSDADWPYGMAAALDDAIAQALADARAEENEACAKVADDWLYPDIAEAIRARATLTRGE